MIEKFENEFATAWMEDGIYIGVFKKNSIIGLEAAKLSVELRKEVTQNKKVKMLVFASHVQAISNDAKKYLSKEGAENVEKFALVTNSVFTTLLGNVFFKLIPQNFPSRIFTNKEEALAWLKKD